MIYRLFNHKDERFYIGSSRDIVKRMKDHNKDENNKKQKWFNLINYKNIKYKIIKEFDDISDIDLRKEENIEINRYLGNELCMNSIKAYSTKDSVIKLKNLRHIQDNIIWNIEKKEIIERQKT